MKTKTVTPSFFQKHKTLLTISGISLVLITGGIAYYLYQKRKKKKQQRELALTIDSGSSSGNRTGIGGGSSSVPRRKGLCQSKSYPINYGTCIDDVKILQGYLKKKGAYLGTPAIDGKFGPKTRAAALKYLGKESFNLIDISRFKKQLKG